MLYRLFCCKSKLSEHLPDLCSCPIVSKNSLSRFTLRYNYCISILNTALLNVRGSKKKNDFNITLVTHLFWWLAIDITNQMCFPVLYCPFIKKLIRTDQSFFIVLPACVAWRFWLGALSNKRGRAEKPLPTLLFYRIRRSKSTRTSYIKGSQ